MSQELLHKIQSFSMDGDASPSLSFAARLARENAWPHAFAERAIREYKRFIYLAMSAGHPVTPSVQVDAVWHLHLTYTRSYWHRLCQDTLGKPLHHEPTKGGLSEGEKFQDWYAKTLESYRRIFDEKPPADLWPDSEQRFGDDQHFVTVNTKRNWIVPKAAVLRASAIAAILVISGLFASGCAGNVFDPFTLKGTDYFKFLIPAFFVTFVIGLFLRSQAKGPGYASADDYPQLRWDQVAYLHGGASRLLTATIARLVHNGWARVSENKTTLEIADRLPDSASDVERQVYQYLPLERTRAEPLQILTMQVRSLWSFEKQQLCEEGLLLSPGRRFLTAVISILPMAIVFVYFGIQRLLIGIQNDKPYGFLLITLIITAIVMIIMLFATPRRTRKGDQILKWLKRNTRRRPNETNDRDVSMDVALFGTTVLVGEMALLAAWYPRPTSTGGGCGTTVSSCGGGGGCGGGGCGGGGGGGGGCGGCGGG